MTSFEASGRAPQPDSGVPSGARAGRNPAIGRVLPFAVYVAFLAAPPGLAWLRENGFIAGAIDLRWLYGVQIACVVAALLWFRREYAELYRPGMPSQTAVLASIVCGAAVFALWIHLDHGWLTLGESDGFIALDASGGIDWPLALVRAAGAVAVVPVMEELFWRSFVMRWMREVDFLTVAPSRAGAIGLLGSSLLFGLEHHQWLAGIIAGLVYGALYWRTGNLWTSVVAHAVTNGLLAAWVMYARAWHYW